MVNWLENPVICGKIQYGYNCVAIAAPSAERCQLLAIQQSDSCLFSLSYAFSGSSSHLTPGQQQADFDQHGPLWEFEHLNLSQLTL
jgi:hypothetical protein